MPGELPVPLAIEVGATASCGTIRYWLAQEALRQAEQRVAAQAATLGGMMTRATLLLGWSVTATIALVAAALSGHWAIPASATACFVFISATFCIGAVWPGRWISAGHDVDWLMSIPYDSEVQCLEAMAGGYQEGINRNAAVLNRFLWLLRGAWITFAAAPVVGGAIAFAIS